MGEVRLSVVRVSSEEATMQDVYKRQYAQSLFWLAWPIGGLLCGIVSLLMKAFDSEDRS